MEGAIPARELPDEAVVVRGGESKVGDMTASWRTNLKHNETHQLSGASLADGSVDEIAQAAKFPHPRIRCTTAGKLREAGFPVEFDRPKGHHVAIQLPEPPSDADFKALRQLFDKSIENPANG